MRAILLVVLVLVAASCALNKSPIMTMDKYRGIEVGMTEGQFIEKNGHPHSIISRDDGTIIFEYVERFSLGSGRSTIVEIRRYYFYVKDGKIVGKQVKIINPPTYENLNNV